MLITRPDGLCVFRIKRPVTTKTVMEEQMQKNFKASGMGEIEEDWNKLELELLKTVQPVWTESSLQFMTVSDNFNYICSTNSFFSHEDWFVLFESDIWVDVTLHSKSERKELLCLDTNCPFNLLLKHGGFSERLLLWYWNTCCGCCGACVRHLGCCR